jgi:hypothetical protein
MISKEELSRWATEQAQLLAAAKGFKPSELIHCAAVIRGCGGELSDLPIALGKAGWFSLRGLSDWQDMPAEIMLVLQDSISEQDELNIETQGEWPEDTLLVYSAYFIARNLNIAPDLTFSSGNMHLMRVRRTRDRLPRWIPSKLQELAPTLLGAVIEALATAWSSPAERVWTYAQRKTRDALIASGKRFDFMPHYWQQQAQATQDAVLILRKPPESRGDYEGSSVE